MGGFSRSRLNFSLKTILYRELFNLVVISNLSLYRSIDPKNFLIRSEALIKSTLLNFVFQGLLELSIITSHKSYKKVFIFKLIKLDHFTCECK